MLEVLARARRFGYLGPGPVEVHLEHALGFARSVGEPPRRAADLGPGGGVPGLVLAACWPATQWTFIEVNERKATFLSAAVGELDLASRVAVLRRRVEVVGREVSHRAQYDLVVARSFGPPSATAECGAPLLRVKGSMVVSDPPAGGEGRWPAGPLAVLGLRVAETIRDRAQYTVLEQEVTCPEQYPRSVGLPWKRPLFHVKPGG